MPSPTRSGWRDAFDSKEVMVESGYERQGA